MHLITPRVSLNTCFVLRREVVLSSASWASILLLQPQLLYQLAFWHVFSVCKCVHGCLIQLQRAVFIIGNDGIFRHGYLL